MLAQTLSAIFVRDLTKLKEELNLYSFEHDLWKTDGTPGGTTFIKSFSGAGFKVYKMYF